MYLGTLYPPDSDLDLSFTSCASTSTSTSTATTSAPTASARSSIARSSLTLSFNERLSTTSTITTTNIPNLHLRPHRKHDPEWCAIKAATTLSSDGALHLRHLRITRLVGRGNLGRVFLCRLRDDEHASFALKVVDRDSLSSKKLSHAETEAEILSALDHPFLPTLYAHFEASHFTCLLMDYCSNGDLHSLLRKQPGHKLQLHAVRFYAAQVLVALEYLHSLGIVYRDLKPENILIREDGHVMLSDFDLCFKADISPKLVKQTRVMNCCDDTCQQEETLTEFVAEPVKAFSRACVGTHEYLAPEIIEGNGHGNGVDWWAFGILVYELLFGITPFKERTKELTLRNISSNKGIRFHVNDSQKEEPGMAEAKDLIERLLMKDPRERLGCTRGATGVKCHPFFNGIKWSLIHTYLPPEVRGLVVKRRKSGKSQMSHVSGLSTPRRRRRWWKRLASLMRIDKGSKYSLNSNPNYYCHVSKVWKCA